MSDPPADDTVRVSVALASGGAVTVSVSSGPSALAPLDRDFVFGLLDRLYAYEQAVSLKRKPYKSGRARRRRSGESDGQYETRIQRMDRDRDRERMGRAHSELLSEDPGDPGVDHADLTLKEATDRLQVDVSRRLKQARLMYYGHFRVADGALAYRWGSEWRVRILVDGHPDPVGALHILKVVGRLCARMHPGEWLDRDAIHWATGGNMYGEYLSMGLTVLEEEGLVERGSRDGTTVWRMTKRAGPSKTPSG